MKKRILIAGCLCYIAGIVIAMAYTEWNSKGMNPELAIEFQDEIRNITRTGMWKRIISTNLVVITVNIAGGLSLGIVTFANTVFNGYVLGYTIKYGIRFFSVGQTMRYILPHGIEILAIILSCYLGFRLGGVVFRELRHRGRGFTLHRTDALITCACYIIIVIASFLEAYVTIPKT